MTSSSLQKQQLRKQKKQQRPPDRNINVRKTFFFFLPSCFPEILLSSFGLETWFHLLNQIQFNWRKRNAIWDTSKVKWFNKSWKSLSVSSNRHTKLWALYLRPVWRDWKLNSLLLLYKPLFRPLWVEMSLFVIWSCWARVFSTSCSLKGSQSIPSIFSTRLCP